jgi:hypothetical protein
MRFLILLLVQLWIMLSVAHADPFDPPQTPEEVQQQKNRAHQQIVENVPSAFRTPLAVFEKFYAGLVAGDASEYSCFTSKLIEEIFESGELTPESLQRLRNGRTDREERDHFLGEFVFKAHPDRPEITFGYRYTFKGAENKRIMIVDRMRLMLIQTPQGWKIDEIEDDPPGPVNTR